MKNITYINAGAGSGKTYKLVETLTDEIKKGSCRANEVILTTFTKKAADELRERARSVLYKEGLFTDAILLDQAQIGTVHAVAMNILSKYWYLVELSPDVKPLADESVDFYINQSLSTLPDHADIKLFNKFRLYFNVNSEAEFWKNQLREIIGFCITNQIDDLTESTKYSCEQLHEIYKPVKGRTLPQPDRIKSWITKITEAISQDKESNKKNERLAYTAEIVKKKHYSFADLLGLSGFITGLPKGTLQRVEELTDMNEELDQLWQTEEVYTLQETYIKRLFELAQKWKQQYQEFKKNKNLIDFNDMEHYCLQLLEKEDIAAEIRGKYKILFVDEFQDSSPIQVQIFSHLSNLVAKSYWVGDPKQAIYGFRGSNTDLIHTVMDLIGETGNAGNKMLNLDTSYRSVKEIVELTNNLFSKVFRGLIPENQVCLKPHKENSSKGALFHIHCEDKNIESYRLAVKNKVIDLLAHTPKNRIAILCRSNSKCQDMASVLRQAGIPVCIESGDLNAQKETELIKALLTLLVEEENDLAKARILYLVNPNFDLSALVDERLEYLHKTAHEKNPQWSVNQRLLTELQALKQRIRHLSVSETIETLILTLNLNTLVKMWGNSKSRQDNLSRLIAIGKEYEDAALNIGLAATIPGFIEYLSSKVIGSMGDTDGIQILTYHKSKGLEWDVCILSDLNNTTLDTDNIVSRSFYGVRFVQIEKPAAHNLYPEVIISLLPWIWGNLKKCPITDVTNLESFRLISEKCIWEEKRLLYVGITRAKEQLFTSGYNGKSNFNWIEKMGIHCSEIPETSCSIDLFNTGNTFISEISSAIENKSIISEVKESGLKAFTGERCSEAPRYISPSRHESATIYQVESLKSFDRPVSLNGVKEMDQLGNAVHHLFCIYENEKTTRQQCDEILRSYDQLTHIGDSSKLIDSINLLYTFLEERYGSLIRIWKETPFQYQEAEQIVRGSIDLLWETSRGVVLVDYKTYPGSNSDLLNLENRHYAGKYGTQIELYKTALNKAGITILDSLLFYAINGELIRFI
ncbi:MAG: UvrD-helicase domain-containing protein [Bacteroidales bacterium]